MPVTKKQSKIGFEFVVLRNSILYDLADMISLLDLSFEK